METVAVMKQTEAQLLGYFLGEIGWAADKGGKAYPIDPRRKRANHPSVQITLECCIYDNLSGLVALSSFLTCGNISICLICKLFYAVVIGTPLAKYLANTCAEFCHVSPNFVFFRFRLSWWRSAC